MAQKRSQIAKDILRRVRWLYVVFLLITFAIIARVVWIQYGPDAAELKTKAHKITFERVPLAAERGDILAGDGRVLATSVPTYSIYMDFAAAGLSDTIFNKEVDSLAFRMSTLFKDKSQAAYKSMFTKARTEAIADAKRKTNRYKLISPRRVDYLEEKEISKFPILRYGPNKGGYISETFNKRIHPLGSLASRSIGRYISDSIKYGVEGAFNEYLQGKDGLILKQRISGSFKVPVPDALNVEPVNGMDVVTTINADVQDVAETALKKQLELGNADWGTVILMEVATGEIHAISNITRKRSGVFEEDFNYAIGRRIEPGSTFKLASLITLLEDGKMPLDHVIDCENGRALVGTNKRSMKLVIDSHPEKVITLRKVFEVSSNIGFSKAVNETYGHDPKRFVSFIKGMGLGEPLGMQIAGERPPLIKEPGTRSWDGTSLVMMSYGYALEITPMHTTALYNAVANNGRMMRPKLVREVQNYGHTVKRFDNEVINSAICSQNTVKMVRECLEGVVDEGTARALKNPYYTVAAKTGTAQIALNRGGYTDPRGGKHYLATMVGYFPADNPKYTCLVAIKVYGPNAKISYYGGGLSGPVFKAIADRVYASNPTWHKTIDTDSPVIHPKAADIKNGNSKQLKRAAGKLSVPVNIDRDTKDWVYVKNESGAQRNPADSNENHRVEYIGLSSSDIEDGVVPSVVGMGLKDAIYLLERQGLTVAFSGKGRVRSQSVPAGSKAIKGDIVILSVEI